MIGDTPKLGAYILLAFSDETKFQCKNIISPYGNRKAGKKIAKKIIEVFEQSVNLKKHFYDIM